MYHSLFRPPNTTLSSLNPLHSLQANAPRTPVSKQTHLFIVVDVVDVAPELHGDSSWRGVVTCPLPDPRTAADHVHVRRIVRLRHPTKQRRSTKERVVRGSDIIIAKQWTLQNPQWLGALLTRFGRKYVGSM